MRNDPFVFHNGRAARTVAELLVIIEESPLAVFEEHVTKERNDFAAWVELGLQEQELAKKMRTTTDRVATISMLRDWLKPKNAMQVPSHFLETAHQKEFLWGLLVGILVGIVLLRIVQVVQ